MTAVTWSRLYVMLQPRHHPAVRHLKNPPGCDNLTRSRQLLRRGKHSLRPPVTLMGGSKGMLGGTTQGRCCWPCELMDLPSSGGSGSDIGRGVPSFARYVRKS